MKKRSTSSKKTPVKKITKKKPVNKKSTKKLVPRKAQAKVSIKKISRKNPIKKPSVKKVIRKISVLKNKSKQVKSRISSKIKNPNNKKTKFKKISPENRFYLNNGLVLKSITELKKELKNMDHLTFYYHVTEHKNDFAAWVYHVFNNKKLAEKIGQVKTKEELIKLL